ncbi:TRAP transporter permease [Alteribacillus sp. YIM 98480]|uniref:TRAP transporter permease n=1 Tax=Alteribacillus sp. YIM 98480 TaxID=2606599 RepID=UPI00131EC356|nr:TRAP transporter permease [Alteribacillus sp. YIM 98480]
MKDALFKITGVILSLFVVWVLNFYPLGPNIFRPAIVLLSSIIIFTVYKSKYRWVDYLLLILGVITFGYALKEIEGVLDRAGIFSTNLDLIFGTLAIILVLEMTRRTVGIALPVIGLVFFLYAIFGQMLPGELSHGGYSYARIITALFTYNGIFGTALAVVATFVAMFIVFAAILNLTGVGNIFLDLSKGIAGKRKGGPAKIATISSALFGSISGSAVANVASTGSFTIPMMKKLGYKGTSAAAIESAASTGGQIMPPIMAAGAFLMADTLGVPYTEIIKAALIPAVLYFITIWFTIDFRSARRGLKGLPPEEIPSVKKLILKDGVMLLPLVILIVELTVFKVSPVRAAFIAIVLALLISFFRKESRPSFTGIYNTLFQASKGIVSIIAPVTCAGIIIGVIGLTGIGGKIASLVISLSGGILIVALILAMVTAIIFGMGLPTTVAYLLVVSVLAPVLSELGIQPIAAHLFIFYFACLSGITPPVALASYTGANIAGAPPMRTAFESSKIAIAAYILPFFFVFEPALLMNGTWPTITVVFITALIGVFAIAASLEGWLIGRLSLLKRGVLFLSSIVLITPGWITDIIGIALLVIVAFFQYYKSRLRNGKDSTSEIQENVEEKKINRSAWF